MPTLFHQKVFNLCNCFVIKTMACLEGVVTNYSHFQTLGNVEKYTKIGYH